MSPVERWLPIPHSSAHCLQVGMRVQHEQILRCFQEIFFVVVTKFPEMVSHLNFDKALCRPDIAHLFPEHLYALELQAFVFLWGKKREEL